MAAPAILKIGGRLSVSLLSNERIAAILPVGHLCHMTSNSHMIGRNTIVMENVTDFIVDSVVSLFFFLYENLDPGD